MKTAIIIGIIIVVVISSVIIFTSMPSETWRDHRTGFTGVALPDENKEKIDCLSKGGLWAGNSCSVPDFDPPKAIECTGECITETVTKIVDGDTIYTKNYKIRLSLTNTPEKNEPRFQEAKSFTAMHCPVGSIITIDQDDLQPYDLYDRMVGKVYCEGGVINEILLSNGLGSISTQYCSTSEFAVEDWAQKYGCVTPKIDVIQSNCDPSYPDFCIPSSPPDLDCKDIPQKKFTVLQPDPHRFDADKNGIGCES